MRKIRLGLMFISIIIATICVVLLFNITAPNPTHRRYSGSLPIINATNPKDIGDSGEQVLATDLKLTNNNDASQRQCICSSPSFKSPNCNRCAITYVGIKASYRIPDFMTDGMILEAKNRTVLDGDDHDLLNQLADYSVAATLSHRALWIYTRVDSQIDDAYYQLAQATGGDIVLYFRVAGYVDPVDAGSIGGLVASGIMFGFCFNIGRNGLRQRRQNRKAIPVQSRRPEPPQTPPPATPPEPPPVPPSPHSPHPSAPPNPIGETMDALDRASDAAKHTRNHID